jgi:ADP-heptose:LPS heptosyltransferase
MTPAPLNRTSRVWSGLRWARRRWESLRFLLLLAVLMPLWGIRAALRGRHRDREMALFRRWKLFFLHGLDDLRQAYWPGIRYERAADIWFHVALIEFFAVLNATEKTATKCEGTDRILVIKLAHFGDALHIFPMMRELRRQRPGAKVDLLAGPWCAGLAKTFGLHDDLWIHTPRLGLFNRGSSAGCRSLWSEMKWLRTLRHRRYDVVLSTSTTTLAEVLLMHALCPARWVGTRLPEQLYPPVGDAALVPYDSRRYEADRVMGLLSLCGMDGQREARLFYPLSAPVVAEADAVLKTAGMASPTAYAVLSPGAGWPGKQWPADRFAALGERLVRECGLAVVLAGSAGERALCDEVAQRMTEPVLHLAGRTSLDQLAAVISRAALFVGNDSGPMHLAACFDIPSVVFFGPTIASKWAPRHAAAQVLQHEDCSGCISWHVRASCLHGNRCMKAISVEEARSAVAAVLGRPPNPKEPR